MSYMLHERGASPHTIRAYRRDLQTFFATTPDMLATPADIRSFLAGQLIDGLQKSTASRRLSSLRSFFRFMHAEGALEVNPAKLVNAPKLPAPLPRFLTIDEIFSMIAAPEGEGFSEVRNRAILELLYSSGLRVSELAGLELADTNLDDAMLMVRGKGKKERLVPVGRKAITALRAYLPLRMALKSPHGAVFLNSRGGALSDRSIRRIVVGYARRLMLSGKVSPHTIRHTFATHLLHGGADLRVIQELLGHSSLSTTQKYTHLDIAQLMDIYDKSHPLAGDGGAGDD